MKNQFLRAVLLASLGCMLVAGPSAAQLTAGNPVLNRNAIWTGLGWMISLTDGTGAATTSNAVAEVYCLYP